jgi:hypothetical protein
MMRSFHTLLLVLVGHSVFGQVHLDVPVRTSGATEDRGVYGLAPGSDHTSLMTVNDAVLDQVRSAAMTSLGDTLYLTTQPSGTTADAGILLRFIAPSDQPGKRWIAVNGSTPRPLVRTDGGQTLRGQIVQGAVCEVVATEDSFILLAPALRGCPSGTVPITERSCISTTRVLGLSFYGAVDHCAMQGGTLCTWGEYVAACYLVGNQLSGMFTNWEWMDDTSNHTQTADQVGRSSCMSQRSAGPLDPGGSTRCCYRPR